MYERERILTYWNATGHIRSPLTGLTLDHRILRPVVMLKNVIELCVGLEISSGKAAALAGSDLCANAPKAILIEGVLQQMNTTQTPDLLLGNLLALCENVHLRDFAALSGALHVASSCYHRTHSDTTASFLVRMVVFSRDNQEELAFVTACVKQQPLSAPRTCKSRPGSQGGIVVKCCALDCMSEEPGAIASVSVAEEDAVSVACHSWKLSYVCGHDMMTQNSF